MIHEKKSFKDLVDSIAKRAEASGEAEFVAEVMSIKGQLMAMVGGLAMCSASEDPQASSAADQALIRAGFTPNAIRLWLSVILDFHAAKMHPPAPSPAPAH